MPRILTECLVLLPDVLLDRELIYIYILYTNIILLHLLYRTKKTLFAIVNMYFEMPYIMLLISTYKIIAPM